VKKLSHLLSEKPLFVIVNNFYTFFIINLFFMVSNILFLYITFFTSISIEALGLILLSLIPMGPALGAVFYTMGKLQREKEISPLADYIKGYKQNFKISLAFWIPQLLLLFILFNNYYYTTRTGNFSVFILLNVCLIMFVLALNLYAFPILVRFEVTLKNLWIISCLYFFKHWKLTFLNMTTLLSIAIIFFQFPFITLLFFASILPYLIMLNLRKVLEEMESQNNIT